MLSDITVCKAGTVLDPNDTATYADPTDPALFPDPLDAPEWLSSPDFPAGVAPSQSGPTPESLCELPTAMQEDGNPAPGNYGAGEVPNIQRNSPGRTVEGQTVLTNGVNVGGCAGTPTIENGDPGPRALDLLAHTLDVRPGQGLRLQIVNCAHLRYFRLILTTSTGVRVPLVRVGDDGVPGAPLQVLGNGVPAGGTYLYKFKVTRPGIFWYHPHHFHSTNRVFRGTYGMIIVTDPDENTLVEGDPAVVAPVLPSAASTVQLVLSDITVCKAPGSNDPQTYVDPSDAVLFIS